MQRQISTNNFPKCASLGSLHLPATLQTNIRLLQCESVAYSQHQTSGSRNDYFIQLISEHILVDQFHNWSDINVLISPTHHLVQLSSFNPVQNSPVWFRGTWLESAHWSREDFLSIRNLPYKTRADHIFLFVSIKYIFADFIKN